ncbi:MAG: type II toxin-antitoxin system PemK/MazF family toxin [Methanomicrobium sp.]|nr:type II toxin-antitoxin system PemK/MazF family toxin [Methanomicrobium sp.]
MSEFFIGDVILAPVFLGQGSEVKVRPAVVMGDCGRDKINICPITSRTPREGPVITIELDDFEKGGLSLFEESYLIVSQNFTVRKSEVVGKKGKLRADKVSEIRRAVKS